MQQPLHFALGDRLRMRKKHPCGSFDWEVVRIGADIGIVCERCGRRVLLPRSQVERRIKEILPRKVKTQDDFFKEE
ncbi:DUF951 domain-containing protein [Dictyobacter arantiisoli]|uniref:DUF951 domain-containing protein n=1 Tax=Dictyobacter arantiisoli TaxID=2014874 RepID=A0A5A5T9S1_9CHLR|nr:DUF951 domain-containing protein [Dictyobacter arantiisoli]GCF07654.1 hypothetical protein KDI_12180 [Dictyobacter arantiisoli]